MATGLSRQLLVARLPTTALLNTSHQQKRTLVTKENFRLPEGYPEPWPYREKGYTKYRFYLDGTLRRIHKNSRLIVVDGNMGADISKTAQEIADRFGFLYMRPFRMDDVLINRYVDLRDYYDEFPVSHRIPDEKMVWADPFHDNVARFQFYMYFSKLEQYFNALAHILNTGQGVVLERSWFSDFCFVNAMRAKNYVGPEFFQLYYYMKKKASITIYKYPHLYIYLDAPVDKCLENIKLRGDTNQIAAVDRLFLQTVKDSFKDAITEMKRHSRILAYDWADPGDTDTIVEDIERQDLDFCEWHNNDLFEDWHYPRDDIIHCIHREHVTTKMQLIINALKGVQFHEVGELHTSMEDRARFMAAMKQLVFKSPYGFGYNAHLGDEKLPAMTQTYVFHLTPERWFEYYLKEHVWNADSSFGTTFDPHGKYYDPEAKYHYAAHH